ncbi:MAG: dienelactone hydrolase family protein [Thermodesulfobacteriota bacterium]
MKYLLSFLLLLTLGYGFAFAEIKTEEVNYTVDGTKLTGYMAFDDSVKGKRPAVIVVHEWWGHNDYARKRAEMLAGLGYVGFALDMYGDGKVTDHPEDAAKFMNEVFNNMEAGVKRFNAAVEIVKKNPHVDPDNIAAIGYCFGGAIVLHMARIGTDLKGVTSFHGNLSSMHKPEPGSVKSKVLVLHGGNDKLVPQEQVDAFKKEMDEGEVEYEIVVYPGADHSFTNPSADKYGKAHNLPLAYNKEADEKSWEKFKEFLKKIFQPENS